MSLATLPKCERLCLKRFDPLDAAAIALWVESEQELRWLAPGTKKPLTTEKVIGWKKPGGTALVLARGHDAEPIGYGELNPMRKEANHLWLGHVILHPDQRRRGTGQAFVHALLNHAFNRLSASRVSLIVFPQNKPAVRCYRRVGFVMVGEEHHRFGVSGTHHRFLRLEIEGPQP